MTRRQRRAHTEEVNVMFAPQLILVPTDFSGFSDKAVSLAADIAEQTNAKVLLLHVVDKLEQCTVDYCLLVEEMQRIESESMKEAARKMKEEVRKIVQSRKIDVTCDVKAGVPYEEILNEQSEKKADLVVIASHGRTGIMKSLIGSVAERVARSATCPVLIAR
jgi:nucleotide-binding universal stress UspA family protein